MNRKTVLISGGTDGIGKGAVIQLLEDGFNVVTFSKNKKKCDLLIKKLKKKYDQNRFLIIQGDVTNESSLNKIVKGAIKQFKAIDILINNAGIGYFSECDKVDMKKFHEMIHINILGVTLLTKLTVPYMKKRKSGLIINLSSVSGKQAFANGEFYSATKFAVMGYSEGIRNELKEFGIKVSTICPGMVKTKFLGRTEELEKRKKRLGKKTLQMLDVKDVNRTISLICNQSNHCNIQDITLMPF